MGILGLAQGFVALAVSFLPAEPNATLAWWLFVGAVVCVVAMVVLLVWPQRTEEPTGPASTNIGHVDNRSVTSHNQMGGQTAFNITNVGSQPRQFSDASASALVTELSKYPPERCGISVIMGVPDGVPLAYQLHDILSQAGWSVSLETQNLVIGGHLTGVAVQAPSQSAQVDALLRWLNQVGLRPIEDFDENRERIDLYIGQSA